MTKEAAPRLRLVPQTVPRDTPKPSAKRKRRNAHRGVFLMKPSGAKAPYWRARHKDPDTGRTRFVRLTEAEARTAETREDAAIKLHKTLAARAEEIRGGAERIVDADNPLDETFDLYFASFGARKRDATQRSYKRGVNRFKRWCALPAVNIRTCRQVTQAALRTYAAHLVGLKLEDGKPRAATTVNRDLKWLRAPLGELTAMGKFALTTEQIKSGLKTIKESKVKQPFCRSAELRAILDACRRHDAAPYGGAFSGRLYPTVLFILLTGMRPKEALLIKWCDVGVDDEGHARIRVPPEVAKTGLERFVYLGHSPLLAHLLAAPNGRSGVILGGTDDALDDARWTATDEHGAPEFDCKQLRRTCGTFLTCAPSIFGAAAEYMSSQQLGHSVEIAQRHYTGVVKVSSEARTTEDAMQLEVKLADCPQL